MTACGAVRRAALRGQPRGALAALAFTPAFAFTLTLTLLTAACAGAHRSPPPRAPTATPAQCVTALLPLVPVTATSWVLVRPRAVFDHPRLGRAMAHAFDDAGEQALFRRVGEVGYDVRTVERAMVAWSPTGSVAVGLGTFDADRIVSLLWERLLPPRRRGDGAAGVARIEGMLARDSVAVAVHAACGVAAWAEGDTRRVDRAILPERAGAPDPAPLLVWHAREVPVEVHAAMRQSAGDALIRRMHDLEVTADLRPDGVQVDLELQGDSPPDGAARLRRALGVLTTSPLGEAVGAGDWLRPEATVVERDDQHLHLGARFPWRALDALADVLRGRVGPRTLPR